VPRSWLCCHAGYAHQAAPDMFKALQSLLGGSREAGHIPLLAQQRAACVQRSVDLLSCYSLLSEVAAACSAQQDQDPDQVRSGEQWPQCGSCKPQMQAVTY
jgi:hypothetical protein